VPLVPNPILVEDLASLRPDGAPGAGPAPTVERAMREVLGASISPHDGPAFVAALERSFTIADPAAMNGRAPTGTVLPATGDGRVWTWSPRGFALQADMGALAGAQASLYRRAQQALEESLPLLKGLTPLIPYDDEEAATAAREVVRSELERVVQELASEGGPNVGLVDQLLTSLIGLTPVQPAGQSAPRIPAETVGGHIGDLRERFGLKRELVNTIEEEQDYTNFLILSDYITGLWAEWGDTRDAFTTGKPFFGTQLVLISRELQVASESVREVYSALDAVLIGQAERATLHIPVGTPPAEVFLGSLLEWADRFLTVDGRQLIENAGRQGALSLEPTLVTLAAEVGAFAAAADPNAAAPTPGFPLLFANVVVHSTLTALQGSLNNLLGYVRALLPPQPVLGYPFQPPTIPPVFSDLEIVSPTKTVPTGVLVRVDGPDLSRVAVTLALGLTRVRRPLVLIPGAPRPWQAFVPRTELRKGDWDVLLSIGDSEWLVERVSVR
jgi:hypothetical protein